MRITLEIDVNLKLDELDDFMGELSEDITDGNTAKEYYITMVDWNYDKDHFRYPKKMIKEE